jgi:RNA polymerase sigma-70 factor (ECF subfamily)
MIRTRPQLSLVAPLSTARVEPDLVDPETIYRRYASYVARVAHRLLACEEDVDDVVQDVFVIALRGLHQLREPGKVRGWLASVTVRVARRKLLVRRARRFLGFDESRSYHDVADGLASPEERALLAKVYRVLDALPVDERLAYCLHHIEGETLEAVACHCRCSLATVKRRVRRAATALEEAFND